MTINEAISFIDGTIDQSWPELLQAWQTLKAHCTQPTDVQHLKPKMPDYLELLSTIDDSRFTVMEGKADVRVGTRLMYDSLVRHFGH